MKEHLRILRHSSWHRRDPLTLGSVIQKVGAHFKPNKNVALRIPPKAAPQLILG